MLGTGCAGSDLTCFADRQTLYIAYTNGRELFLQAIRVEEYLVPNHANVCLGVVARYSDKADERTNVSVW